jgi:hypothetical protein
MSVKWLNRRKVYKSVTLFSDEEEQLNSGTRTVSHRLNNNFFPPTSHFRSVVMFTKWTDLFQL